MLASLRLRFLLALMGVVLVSVGTEAVLVSKLTTNEFYHYVAGSIARDQLVTSTLLSTPLDAQDPKQMQAVLDTLAGNADARFVASDSSGRVIAYSGDAPPGVGVSMAVPVPGTPPIPLPSPGLSYGQSAHVLSTQTFALSLPAPKTAAPMTGSVPIFMFVSKADPGPSAPSGKDVIVARFPSEMGPNESTFLGAMNGSLLTTAGVTSLTALLLALLLGRGILGPVEALTLAARRMERGDLSGRVAVRAPGELGELARAFNAMADGLSRLERVRRNMVTDIAHELRTPLTNIRGYLEALRDGVIAPDAALLDSLHEEALLLTRLVEDLQELELAEAGQLRLARRPVALDELISRAVQAVQPTAAAKGVLVEATPAADLPPLDADPDRLGQVFRNLLNNAITHTPAGGRVDVAAQAQGDQITVRVSDTGSGIAPDQLPHIFDRFFRGDPSRARTTGGAGLGLAIVAALVLAHGGQVRAESPGASGSGSIFTVELPVYGTSSRRRDSG